MFGALITMLTGIRIIKNINKDGLESVDGDNIIEKGIALAGYAYDAEQDIFYCSMNSWQRNMGYSHLYDESMALFGMIVDCEPIYFEYNNKMWLIELWKGQYDLNTGCEVGIYTADKPNLNVPEIYKYMFYNCASDEERLTMSFTLKKNGKNLFSRDEKHWWLAGFKLGEYSEPSELTMNLNITLKNSIMCHAFIEGLINAGYSEDEIIVNGNNVGLTFDEPRTPQPTTRTEKSDKMIQKKNELLCDSYNDIIEIYDKIDDKIDVIKNQAPDIYQEIMEKATLIRYLRNMKDSGIL
ncbi:DUF4474 domain-containing protein [Clostridium sp.]|uniref:DUF4474 domain-containing protein n=1 Tax=Clostridium sp. TaxID=1506 RepID=UPI00283FC87E|nr:DUF4474 domain-containing protein [Clostridium sp.]MDR3596464.1 DUF4474 domain-containing protein [Clostridium sp.]